MHVTLFSLALVLGQDMMIAAIEQGVVLEEKYLFCRGLVVDFPPY